MELEQPRLAANRLERTITELVRYSYDMHRYRSDVDAVDLVCQSNGVISLSSLRQKYEDDFKDLVDRGKITSEDEYYNLKYVLDGSQEFTPEVEEKYWRMIAEYEKSGKP
jgi:hypothetical protein